MKALPITHLSAAKFTLLALVLGVGLSLPALRVGLIADDYAQRETMLGTGGGA